MCIDGAFEVVPLIVEMAKMGTLYVLTRMLGQRNQGILNGAQPRAPPLIQYCSRLHMCRLRIGVADYTCRQFSFYCPHRLSPKSAPNRKKMEEEDKSGHQAGERSGTLEAVGAAMEEARVATEEAGVARVEVAGKVCTVHEAQPRAREPAPPHTLEEGGDLQGVGHQAGERSGMPEAAEAACRRWPEPCMHAEAASAAIGGNVLLRLCRRTR
jgi:hypothetical protein